jgi:hypothetical protein
VHRVQVLPHTHPLQPQVVFAVVVEQIRVHFVPVIAGVSKGQAGRGQDRQFACRKFSQVNKPLYFTV